MSATPTLISFCIPTFNRANCLREALKSIAQQLRPEIEVVVSDNASTDDTRQVVREYQQQYPGIRFSANETNLGYDRNLLRCLELACGEYVWLFGSDDLLCEGAVEIVQRKILRAARRPTLVYINHDVVDNQGNAHFPNQVGSQRDTILSSAANCIGFLGLNLGYMSALVVRRQSFLAVEGVEEYIGSGWIHLYLVLAALSAGGPICYVGRPLVRARRSLSVDYDLTERFFVEASRVFWSARRHGYPAWAIYRAMNRTVRGHYLRIALAFRCDAPDQLVRSFPVFFRTCWRYPWFWLLLVPLRFVPRSLAVWLRAKARALRARRYFPPGATKDFAHGADLSG
ncbi:MAG: glycosyltransferase family 2 protein [Acidobacteria bacterium]|nr:glycosyltransferase family 2 protein [Acidobacteriota bacterium]